MKHIEISPSVPSNDVSSSSVSSNGVFPGSVCVEGIEVRIVDGGVVINLDGTKTPQEIRAGVEALARSEPGMKDLAGRFVHIFSPEPAVVAAFVFAAKPWLRAFTVNGAVVVPPPKEEKNDNRAC